MSSQTLWRQLLTKRIQPFVEATDLLLQERIAACKMHPSLCYGPDNRIRRRRKAVFNPAWFPIPQDTQVSAGHIVRRGADEYGKVIYVDRHETEEVGVYFFKPKELETISVEDFLVHTSRGGKTTWLLED